MKLIPALLLLTLAVSLTSPASAAPDQHFDGSAATVTGDTAVLGGPGGARRSLDLTPGSASRSIDNGQPPTPTDGNDAGGLGQYKTGLMWGLGAGAFGALLAFGLGMGPVGIAGLGLLGAGAGLGIMGKSPMEKLGGAAIGGAGIGLGLAVALGATPFGWPMLALAAVGAIASAGAVSFFGK